MVGFESSHCALLQSGSQKNGFKVRKMATSVTPSGRKPISARLIYSLTCKDKKPKQGVLAQKPHPGRPVNIGDDTNRLLHGENLEFLVALLDDQAVCGHVRCIYIDPPYATSMAFVNRNVQHAYSDILQGAAYTEFLRQRLIVLRELLADDGSIFVHLDRNMAFEAKIVMDITRAKCDPKNSTRRQFGNISDHILFYTKMVNLCGTVRMCDGNRSAFRKNTPALMLQAVAALRRYRSMRQACGRVILESLGGKLPPPGKHWQYRPSKLEQMDKDGEIYWSPNGNPRRKVFFDSAKGIPVQDIWLPFKDAHNQNILITGYPTEKNYDLLSRIIRATTNPGDWVLDCFCGSGTTLEAARQLGRRFIGIDNSESAIEATVTRLSSGRKRMGDFVTRRKSVTTDTPGATLFG